MDEELAEQERRYVRLIVDIYKIKVGDRIRKDFGDIEELADNIRKNGLLNPITVNQRHELLAGERRLRACKLLGWTQVDVHMVESENEVQDLEIEMAENTVRRNFTGSELAEGIRRQMAIESEKAQQRIDDARRRNGSGNISGAIGDARDKAGEAFGISGKQAEKVVFVDEHRDMLDPADFAEWDEGKLSTNKAYQRIKAAQQQAEEEKTRAIRERDAAEQERDKAYRTAQEKQREVDELQAKLSEQPEPVVIEREVVKEVEVVPEDYGDLRRRVNDLAYDNQQLMEENQKAIKEKRKLKNQLDQANELLGERERNSDANRDVEQLINNTYEYLRRHGGKSRAFDQFHRVDSSTQEECRKSLTALAGFAQSILMMMINEGN